MSWFRACVMVVVSLCWIDVQAQALDITKVVEGTIEEVKPGVISILCAANNSKFLATIDPNTVYDNVQKLSDLKKGDEVQVNYQINHFKNIAITVTKMDVQGG
jgi:hypothetical protein